MKYGISRLACQNACDADNNCKGYTYGATNYDCRVQGRLSYVPYGWSRMAGTGVYSIGGASGGSSYVCVAYAGRN
eukprot:SAG25_NODE_3390_length_1100_cov_1.259740_2_plen_75_part_00